MTLNSGATFSILTIIMLLGVIIFSQGCGDESKASNPAYAQEIQSPDGFKCFAIIGESGSVIGGNCVKE